MKLTKQEALEKTRDQWVWLADNPTESKSDYFGPSRHEKRVPFLQCYCCEYVIQAADDSDRFGMPCASEPDSNTEEKRAYREKYRKHCPLKNLWPRGCEDADSPFRKWYDVYGSHMSPAVLKFRKECAQEIVDACNQELKKYEDNPNYDADLLPGSAVNEAPKEMEPLSPNPDLESLPGTAAIAEDRTNPA